MTTYSFGDVEGAVFPHAQAEFIFSSERSIKGGEGKEPLQ
jgi:hypothetical protein